MFSFGEYQGILDFSLRDAMHKCSMWCPSVCPLGRLSNSTASLSVRHHPALYPNGLTHCGNSFTI